MMGPKRGLVLHEARSLTSSLSLSPSRSRSLPEELYHVTPTMSSHTLLLLVCSLSP